MDGTLGGFLPTSQEGSQPLPKQQQLLSKKDGWPGRNWINMVKSVIGELLESYLVVIPND